MTRIAFVGLGAMGGRMARRLLGAGHDLVVWNRSPARAEPLVAAGAAAARTPADAAARADVVMTMLATPAALRAVTEGPDGVAAGVARSGATVIEMSTVGPDAITRLAAALPEGAPLMDAPVLGSLSEVEEGTLTIFAGGPEELVARWTPLLSDLGTPVRVGPLGRGAAAKLVANSTLLGVLGVLGEAVALGRGLGVPRETLLRVLAATPVGAQAERRTPVLTGAVPPLRFALELAVKDADLVLEAGERAGVDLRLAEAARAWFAEAAAAGLGAADYSAVLPYIAGDTAGGTAG